MDFLSVARPSPIAGTWYSSDPDRLASQVNAFIDSARLKEDDLPGEPVGIMAPHAGYRYSGRTAGYAYRAVRATSRALVVILSPYHPFTRADLLTTTHNAYQTPLGSIPVACPELDSLEKLLITSGVHIEQVARDEEHSLEIQLPFLQCAWQAPFQILPLMVRTLNPELLKSLAQALNKVLPGKDFLLVASSDLSHFYPLETAQQLDAEMLRRVGAFDPSAVLSAETEGRASACGAGAIAAMLWTARLAGADHAQILNYSTSADDTGDATSVVGYGAAVVTKTI